MISEPAGIPKAVRLVRPGRHPGAHAVHPGWTVPRYDACGMKRSLALIATAVCLASCAHRGPLSLGEADTGRAVQLAVGQTLTLRLASDLSTGHTWQIATDPDARVLIVVDSGYDRPRASAPGTTGQAWWVLHATGAGSTSIALRYGRPWESVPDARQFTMNITVK